MYLPIYFICFWRSIVGADLRYVRAGQCIGVRNAGIVVKSQGCPQLESAPRNMLKAIICFFRLPQLEVPTTPQRNAKAINTIPLPPIVGALADRWESIVLTHVKG